MRALLLASALAVTPPVALPQHLATPLCVGCATEPADGAATLARLRAGETVRTEDDTVDPTGTPRRIVEVTALLPYRPSQIWSVLVDFHGRVAWQPSATKVAVVHADGDRVWVDEWARFLWVDVQYRLALTLDPEAGRIGFAMDEESPHDIGGASGHWQLRRVDDGRQTLVAYRAWIDFGHGLPRWLQRALLQYSLPSLLANLRAEATRRFGAPPS